MQALACTVAQIVGSELTPPLASSAHALDCLYTDVRERRLVTCKSMSM